MNSFAKLSKFQKLFAGIVLAAVLLSPVSAWAAVTDLKSLVNAFIDIINLIQKFLVALSIFIIIWGTFRYLVASGDKERLTQARDVIVYGLLGIVIMYTIIGIIGVLLNTIKVDSTNLPTIPQFSKP